MKLSEAGVTLGTMTTGNMIVTCVSQDDQELHIALDCIGASPTAQLLCRFLAGACVAPGSYVRSLEDDDLIRVKIDADSQLGKFLASSG